MIQLTGAELESRAASVADGVLFPAAMEVDAADGVPVAHLDALAAAGLYGLAGPSSAGGDDASLATFCNVIEILAGGCLATTFVWLQHHGVVRAIAASGNDQLRSSWLEPLCRAERRAGVALGGARGVPGGRPPGLAPARPGPPLLCARPVAGGYVLDGTAPWVTGWNRVDAVYTLARLPGERLVAALVPAATGEHLSAQRLSLVAVNASWTVELTFAGYFVPDTLVCSVFPQADFLARDAEGLRPNGSLSLGVAGRCCRLIGPSPLDAELIRRRERLDAADASAMPAARAAASHFAFEAAGAAVAAAGGTGILVGQHPQRLAREALFLLVFGSRPAIKESLTELLRAVPA
jgi:alkylation response protein AidB-like acyl-CoA dehydrogenase